jgi:hypothetical protein
MLEPGNSQSAVLTFNSVPVDIPYISHARISKGKTSHNGRFRPLGEFLHLDSSELTESLGTDYWYILTFCISLTQLRRDSSAESRSKGFFASCLLLSCVGGILCQDWPARFLEGRRIHCLDSLAHEFN